MIGYWNSNELIMSDDMSKTIEQAAAELATANANYLNELERDIERLDGSGAQEARRETHRESLRDAIYQGERAVEEVRRSAFNDKSLEELYAERSRVERERDAKGPSHPEYKMAGILIASIDKTIKERQRG